MNSALFLFASAKISEICGRKNKSFPQIAQIDADSAYYFQQIHRINN